MRQLSLLLLLACTACSAAGPVALPGGSAVTAPASDVLARMRSLVGNAACTDTAQCMTVPLGERACGGPAAYLAYSTVQTQGAALQALAARYAAQQRAAQASAGMASTCQFLPDPGAICRAGTCVLGTADAAAR